MLTFHFHLGGLDFLPEDRTGIIGFPDRLWDILAGAEDNWGAIRFCCSMSSYGLAGEDTDANTVILVLDVFLPYTLSESHPLKFSRNFVHCARALLLALDTLTI